MRRSANGAPGPEAAGTVGSALAEARARLQASGSASLDAQVLLAHVLAKDRAWIIAHHADTLAPGDVARFRDMVERRQCGTPVAYLLGRAHWYDLELQVRSGVLIPRPETELLLERARSLAVELRAAFIADVGTGSGALAIGLARGLSEVRVAAVDRSEDALAVARLNVARYGLSGRVELIHGDLVEPLETCPDLIVGNLPYLSDAMMDELDADVRSEPALALHGGATGLELYTRLGRMLDERGWRVPLVIEIDPRQAGHLASVFPRRSIAIERDYAGMERIVTILPGRPQ